MELVTTILVALITAIFGPIICNRYLVKRKQEQTSRLTYGKRVGIRACNGKYIMSDLNNGEKLLGRERHIKEWELFEIVDATDPFSTVQDKAVHYGDKVAFRAINNSNFVGADFNSQGELVARVPHVKAWEMFTLLRPRIENRRLDKSVRYGSVFALQANNGRQVRFNRDGDSGLYADVPHIKEWEVFVFIDPAQPK